MPSGVSVDLGGTKIAAARFDSGAVVDELRVLTDGQAGASAQIEVIFNLLQRLNPQKHEKVGVAVSGRVNAKGQWHAVNSETFKGIDCVPLKNLLEEKLGRPVHVVNDAEAGGVAESRFGAGLGADSFAYITVSTGVGGTCVLHGEPVRSANGLAGHLGFMTTREGSLRCGSGRVGTVESVASGRAMEKIALAITKRSYTTKEIFTSSSNAEEWAQRIVKTSACSIAGLGLDLACAIGIERIVLGGSVGLLTNYQGYVRSAIAEEPAIFQIDVRGAELGQESVMLGALCGDD